MGSAKVAGIDDAYVFVANASEQLFDLPMACLVEIGIEVAAEGSGHIGFRVANEKYFAHAFHPPHK